jgi:hypothetical protein
MTRWSRRRVLLFSWLAAASLFAFWFVWLSIERYQAYKSAPTGWIIDYFTPWPIIVIGALGFWGLMAVALATLFVFLKSRFSS